MSSLRSTRRDWTSAPAPFKRGLRAVLWVFVASASFVESGLRPLMRKENFYAWIVAPALLLGMGAGVLTFVVLDFSVVGEAFWQNMAAAGLAFTTFFMPALYGYFRVVRRRWIAALEFVAYLRELAAGEELTGAD